MAVGYLVLGLRDLGLWIWFWMDMTSADLMKATKLGFTFPHDSTVREISSSLTDVEWWSCDVLIEGSVRFFRFSPFFSTQPMAGT